VSARRGDVLWALVLLAVFALLVYPPTHAAFVAATAHHPYMVGFAKFFVLATMGELLARRLGGGAWQRPPGLLARAVVWGGLGAAIVLVFDIFAGGVTGALKKGLLPGGDSRLAFAFFVSTTMNLTFAPAMMLFHRVTDTFIDLRHARPGARVTLDEVVGAIDWRSFVTFVLAKTIPLFWIPAHTITFLLPAEYRVLAAALLSIALGAILARAGQRVRPSGPRTRTMKE
jgi:hypothetical protein